MKSSGSHSSYTMIPSTLDTDLSGRPIFTLIDKTVASSPPARVDSAITAASLQYDEFGKFLVSYVPKDTTPSTGRQKLMNLTREQFQDLCIDVYDELIRRNDNSNATQIPFLPPQAEFHPKRNQARQKLATLPTARYQNLCSDVQCELGRRYPECKEGPFNPSSTTVSTYDNSPFAVDHNAPGDRTGDWTTPNRLGGISKNPPSGWVPAKISTTLL